MLSLFLLQELAIFYSPVLNRRVFSSHMTKNMSSCEWEPISSSYELQWWLFFIDAYRIKKAHCFSFCLDRWSSFLGETWHESLRKIIVNIWALWYDYIYKDSCGSRNKYNHALYWIIGCVFELVFERFWMEFFGGLSVYIIDIMKKLKEQYTRAYNITLIL